MKNLRDEIMDGGAMPPAALKPVMQRSLRSLGRNPASFYDFLTWAKHFMVWDLHRQKFLQSDIRRLTGLSRPTIDEILTDHLENGKKEPVFPELTDFTEILAIHVKAGKTVGFSEVRRILQRHTAAGEEPPHYENDQIIAVLKSCLLGPQPLFTCSNPNRMLKAEYTRTEHASTSGYAAADAHLAHTLAAPDRKIQCLDILLDDHAARRLHTRLDSDSAEVYPVAALMGPRESPDAAGAMEHQAVCVLMPSPAGESAESSLFQAVSGYRLDPEIFIRATCAAFDADAIRAFQTEDVPAVCAKLRGYGEAAAAASAERTPAGNLRRWRLCFITGTLSPLVIAPMSPPSAPAAPDNAVSSPVSNHSRHPAESATGTKPGKKKIMKATASKISLLILAAVTAGTLAWLSSRPASHGAGSVPGRAALLAVADKR